MGSQRTGPTWVAKVEASGFSGSVAVSKALIVYPFDLSPRWSPATSRRVQWYAPLQWRGRQGLGGSTPDGLQPGVQAEAGRGRASQQKSSVFKTVPPVTWPWIGPGKGRDVKDLEELSDKSTEPECTLPTYTACVCVRVDSACHKPRKRLTPFPADSLLPLIQILQVSV